MPGNIQQSALSGVMPYALCTAFAESREYVQLQSQYHDGTIQRCQLAQTSRHTFTLAQRLTASQVTALKAFWDSQQGGATPFYFYNLIEGTYDPTGNSSTGRYTVRFQGSWVQVTGLARTDVPPIPTDRSRVSAHVRHHRYGRDLEQFSTGTKTGTKQSGPPPALPRQQCNDTWRI
jgi:hypothetical protein